MDLILSQEKTQFLLDIARDAISTQLDNKPLHLIENPYPEFEQVQGVFVTLSLNDRLRGCIGNIIGQFPLYIGIQNMAIQAAFNDPRFPALSKSEFESIQIEISILSPLLPIHANQIEVGTHGLLLRYQGRSGVLLPQVPTEQGWNKKEYLEALTQKAGVPVDALNHKDTELFGFTATIIKEGF
jgi:AmmeMemoRadiSam system protein A